MLPVHFSYRDGETSPDLQQYVQERADRLEKFFNHIIGVEVTLSCPNCHHRNMKNYNVRIQVRIPGEDIIICRTPKKGRAGEDEKMAIREAFKLAERQVEDFSKRLQKEKYKTSEGPAHGIVARMVYEEGHGFLLAPDGREIYFHQNSVVGENFEDLSVGQEVRYTEEQGIKGPQASTVTPVGKSGYHVFMKEGTPKAI